VLEFFVLFLPKYPPFTLYLPCFFSAPEPGYQARTSKEVIATPKPRPTEASLYPKAMLAAWALKKTMRPTKKAKLALMCIFLFGDS
jgi:hypothetical protein